MRDLGLATKIAFALPQVGEEEEGGAFDAEDELAAGEGFAFREAFCLFPFALFGWTGATGTFLPCFFFNFFAAFFSC